ncbi:MAG: alpha/beta fold hydrolase [Nannocystaceae bacterium]
MPRLPVSPGLSRVPWLLTLCLLGCDPSTQPTAPAKPQPQPKTAVAAQSSAADDKAVPEAAEVPETPEVPTYAEAGGVKYLEMVTGLEDGADTNVALPMIIAIHGLGDRPENFADVMKGFPERARVILPRALDDHNEGFSWFPVRARDKDVELLSEKVGVAADKLAEMTKALQAARPTTGKPVVTGFSQGGMLAFTLASRHPELFAAAVPVSGWLPDPLWPKKKPASAAQNPPVVALHGDTDRALLIDRTRASVANQKKLGYAVELKEYPGVGHQITAEMRAELWDLLGKYSQAASK